MFMNFCWKIQGWLVENMYKKLLVLVVLAILLALPWFLFGAKIDHDYPKVANLFFKWDISASEAKELAQWDILVIDMEVQRLTLNSLKLIKKYNPDVKLLAYLAVADIRGDSGTLSGTLRKKLYNQIDARWWLKDASGNKVEWWPGNPLINVSDNVEKSNGKDWADVLANFLANDLMSTGYWDGVFLDNLWSDVSFLKRVAQVDINNDGKEDATKYMNDEWRDGMTQVLQKVRNKLGSQKLIVANGGEYYDDYVNGVLYEHFPAKGWKQTMQKYELILNSGQAPVIGILNVNVQNTGKKTDYQKMRFGLASALLDDGYYSFDNGDQTHHEIWWYDEYDAYLGAPAGAPVEIFGKTNFTDGVWRRDFKNGLVLVNSGASSKTVNLGGEYEKIHGAQDPDVNDGLFVDEVELAPEDGLLLLRPIDKITHALFVNGSFARIFNNKGGTVRSGFFSYEDKFKGGSQVVIRDIDHDDLDEYIVAEKNKIMVFDDSGVKLREFYPYTEKYTGSINFNVGDINGNGFLEIVTGTGVGAGPQVRIFNIDGRLVNPGFFAYEKHLRGGVHIAIGDLNNDNFYEIIVGSGEGGGPHVRVFAQDGRLLNPGFFAYDKSWRTGVNISVGDINGDGKDDIVTGPGQGGEPQIRAFNEKGEQIITPFYAFADYLRDGVRVGVTDLDGDKKAEIIATTTNVFTLAGL